MWQEHEQASQRQRDWNEVDGQNWEADSRDNGEAYLKEQSVMLNEDDVWNRESGRFADSEVNLVVVPSADLNDINSSYLSIL